MLFCEIFSSWLIRASYHVFERTIWNKLKIFKNQENDLSPKNHLNQTYGYWLITPNHQTLCIETNIF